MSGFWEGRRVMVTGELVSWGPWSCANCRPFEDGLRATIEWYETRPSTEAK